MRWLIRAVVTTLLASLVAGVPAAAAADRASRWAECGVWKRIRPPQKVYGFPRDIEVVSPREAWFTGWEGFVGGAPVVMHWEGRRWAAESFPTPAGRLDDVDLADLAVTASGTVWGVGHVDPDPEDAAHLRPLAARWTGTRWRLVHVGIPRRASFNAVAAVPGTDRLWAVGSYGNSYWGPGGRGTFVARWNGNVWQRVPSPSPGEGSQFSDVVVVGGSVWAVGSVMMSGHSRTLAARWNGHRWLVDIGPRGGLDAVDGVRADQVWAVGPSKDTEPQRSLLRRWDGRAWTTVQRWQGISALRDVIVTSPTDAWAVGYRGSDPRPVVMRRHGSPWHRAQVPDVSGQFWAIDGTPHNLWALRWYVVGDSGRLDTFHRC